MEKDGELLSKIETESDSETLQDTNHISLYSDHNVIMEEQEV